MPDTFYIQLVKPGDKNSCLLKWYCIGNARSDAPLSTGAGNLADFMAAYAATASGRNKKPTAALVGLLPGEQLSYHHVELPTQNKQQMWQALPYMVEESVAEDIEQLSLAAQIKRPGLVRAALVKKEVLNSWQELFEQEDLPLKTIVGMPDILPAAAGLMSIMFHDGQVLIKSDEYCLQLEPDNVHSCFTLLSLDAVENVHIHSSAVDQQSADLAKRLKIELDADADLAVEWTEYPQPAMESWLATQQKPAQHSINLLASGVRGSAQFFMQGKVWVNLAVAAVLLVCVQVGLNLASGYFFHDRASKLQAAALAHYQKLFPDENVSDIKTQWNHKLSKSGASANQETFPLLFTVLVQSLKKEAKLATDLDLLEFRYDSDSGALRMEIYVKSVAVLDAVKQAVAEKGLEMEILSASEDQGKVKSSIRVSVL